MFDDTGYFSGSIFKKKSRKIFKNESTRSLLKKKAMFSYTNQLEASPIYFRVSG